MAICLENKVTAKCSQAQVIQSTSLVEKLGESTWHEASSLVDSGGCLKNGMRVPSFDALMADKHDKVPSRCPDCRHKLFCVCWCLHHTQLVPF